MKKDKTQPAKINYFFHQSYVDLGNIISGAWRKNVESAGNYGRKISGNFSEHGFWGVFPMIAYVFATVSMFVFGSIVCAMFTIAHITIIIIINVLVYIVALILGLFEHIYISFHGIFGACPYCKNHYKIPTYVCDCGAEHTNLVPNKYGVIKRQCQCGKKLPTSILTGRSKIKAKCPVCNHILDNSLGTQEVVPVCIPVIGGPSVGKTCYITAVMKELIENVVPATGASIEFYNQSNEVTCNNMISLYNSGTIQQKTSDMNPAAYNFFINSKKHGPQRLMYFYDIAGEAFTTSDALSSQKQYEYSHGFIFIIDPLSIPRVREKFVNEKDYDSYAVSDADINETFDSFMRNLSKISGLSPNELSKIACAIVVNKIDAYDLSEIIGKQAIDKVMQLDENKKKDAADLMDSEVKKFLNGNGMSNFVKNVSMCFKNTRFFAVSSLGHKQNGQAFEGNMTLEPFAWITSRVDSSMKAIFKEYAKK